MKIIEERLRLGCDSVDPGTKREAKLSPRVSRGGRSPFALVCVGPSLADLDGISIINLQG